MDLSITPTPEEAPNIQGSADSTFLTAYNILVHKKGIGWAVNGGIHVSVHRRRLSRFDGKYLEDGTGGSV